jgi:phosphoserine phosphatase RsbU/P
MVWLRFHVLVPPDRSPLAVRLDRDQGACSPGEFWVNGIHLGTQGRFPPNPFTTERCATGVFDIPPGVVAPGETAVVSWRGWLSPIWRSRIDFTPPVLFPVTIGSRTLELSRESDARARTELALRFDVFLWSVEALIAFLLLVIWRRTKAGGSLFWFAMFALSWSAMGYWNALRPIGLSYISFWLVSSLFWAIVNVSLFEFIRTVLHPPLRAVRTLEGIGILWPVLLFLPALATTSISGLGLLVVVLYLLTGITFLGIIALATWAWWRGPADTRGLAITLFCAGVAYMLVDNIGIITRVRIGIVQVQPDNLATALVTAAMCYQLLVRLWDDWRRKEELDAEFDAAREVQQQLVSPAVDLPGFKIQSAYVPAKRVGGDFFRILPGPDESVLLVVGDVSGKGLKAAMTVSAIMGALRGCPSHNPAGILAYLNHVLYGQVGGFVTCCVALIERDGAMTLANAGNPAPYCNGQELAVEAGLPLGILPDASYQETRFEIASGDTLTFVSDGVLEATNAEGELYGFERTRAISDRSAHQIAEAAELFGQEDDITVLSITRTPDPHPVPA